MRGERGGVVVARIPVASQILYYDMKATLVGYSIQILVKYVGPILLTSLIFKNELPLICSVDSAIRSHYVALPILGVGQYLFCNNLWCRVSDRCQHHRTEKNGTKLSGRKSGKMRKSINLRHNV